MGERWSAIGFWRGGGWFIEGGGKLMRGRWRWLWWLAADCTSSLRFTLWHHCSWHVLADRSWMWIQSGTVMWSVFRDWDNFPSFCSSFSTTTLSFTHCFSSGTYHRTVVAELYLSYEHHLSKKEKMPRRNSANPKIVVKPLRKDHPRDEVKVILDHLFDCALMDGEMVGFWCCSSELDNHLLILFVLTLSWCKKKEFWCLIHPAVTVWFEGHSYLCGLRDIHIQGTKN